MPTTSSTLTVPVIPSTSSCVAARTPTSLPASTCAPGPMKASVSFWMLPPVADAPMPTMLEIDTPPAIPTMSVWSKARMSTSWRAPAEVGLPSLTLAPPSM